MKQMFVLFFAMIVLGCQQQHNPQPANTQQSSAQYKENVSVVLSVKKTDEQQTPNFTWYDQTGTQISFTEFSKGKPVLVNFWATWCGPCVKEMPDLVSLNEEYSAKGALIIGISVDRGGDALNLVSDFTKENNVKYPIVIDNGDLEKAFGGLRGIPTTFYIDKNGKIVKKLIGMQSKETFAREFDAIL